MTGGAAPLPLPRASGIFAGIMPAIADIGTRVELVPMDGHFHDITVALYRQSTAAGPAFLVHSYSTLDGSGRRLEDVRSSMAALGGLQPSMEAPSLLAFPCGEEHGLAVRRLFLEACKVGSPDDAAPLPPVHGGPQVRPDHRRRATWERASIGCRRLWEMPARPTGPAGSA